MYIWCSVIFCLMVSAVYVDAANCDVDGDCDAGNNEVCDIRFNYVCVCDAGYTDNNGICDPVDCGALTEPGNGTADTSNGTTFGSQANLSCDSGFSPDVAAPSDCRADGNWAITSHTCTIKDCGTLTSVTPDNVAVDTTAGTTFGSQATFSCDSGYSSQDATATSECQADGAWSVTSHTCTIKDCGTLTSVTPDNVAVDTTAGTTFGSKATFSCDAGYSPDATSTSECQAGGAWSVTSHTCTIKDCGAKIDPADGTTTLDSARVTTYQATATVTCHAGFGLDTDTATDTIRCLAFGSWSALPTCTAGDAATCGAPSPPYNGVISTPATASTEGHVATVACNTDYTLNGASTMTCQYNDTWSTPGTCSGCTSVAWSFYVLLLLGVMTRLMKE